MTLEKPLPLNRHMGGATRPNKTATRSGFFEYPFHRADDDVHSMLWGQNGLTLWSWWRNNRDGVTVYVR